MRFASGGRIAAQRKARRSARVFVDHHDGKGWQEVDPTSNAIHLSTSVLYVPPTPTRWQQFRARWQRNRWRGWQDVGYTDEAGVEHDH